MSESNKSRIQDFYTSFQASRSDLSSRLEQLKAKGSVTPDGLNEFTLDVAKLRKDLVDATSYLPSYDQRQYESFLKGLEQSIEQLRASAVQKPKFSFKRKAAAASSPAPTPVTQAKVATVTAAVEVKDLPSTSTNRVLSDRSKEYLTWSSIPNSTSSISDLTISDLDQCIVNFTSSPKPDEGSSDQGESESQHKITALHIRNITNSILIFPPIEGSALLHDLKQCTIVLGCHQVSSNSLIFSTHPPCTFRMHSSSRINVYLSIPSNPIIEHCTNIAFTSYPNAILPSLASDDLQNLASKHHSVQDFSHIRATPSPNWRILKDEEAVKDDEWPITPSSDKTAVEHVLRRLLPHPEESH
ncbi:hypothetical protein NLI96_g11423 [Meripilus lineatus]|uniref:C-CAP/cofactor C-like domain-containing protein n=1 Tax=Meripilus lineatus TaxID=2056292 RepID=A0AAD5URV7_9APHY|nr:hypothetical protein NLI96_g11423 [Physisporinus lineatus]